MNKARLVTVIAAVVLAAPSTASALPHVKVFSGSTGDLLAATTAHHDTAKNSVGNIR